MIIYRPNPDSATSISQLVKGAIDRGIGWIQLPTTDMTDDDAAAMAESVIPLCRDNDIILTLENHVATVDKLRNHGVHLMPGSMHPAFVRERLGPHAIVGVQIDRDYDLSGLKGVDVDYLTLDSAIDISEATKIAQRLIDLEMELPLVITGNYTPGDIAESPISGILTTD